jgi:hypothetical protein
MGPSGPTSLGVPPLAHVILQPRHGQALRPWAMRLFVDSELGVTMKKAASILVVIAAVTVTFLGTGTAKGGSATLNARAAVLEAAVK